MCICNYVLYFLSYEKENELNWTEPPAHFPI